MSAGSLQWSDGAAPHEALWRSEAGLPPPGKVQVAVLPAIDVTKWKAEQLEERIEGVRQLYLDTLENWPTEKKTRRGKK